MTTTDISTKNITSKLVLLGDVGPGKTSLVLRFCKGQFNDCQESTIGSAFFSQAVSLDESTVKLEIWDTAGQERYHCLAPMYYRGAAAAIIVYDITSASTFRKAKKWVEELQRHATQTIFTVLVGNKADLDERREVNTEVGKEYAKENGLRFYETSAKTGHNVNGLFHEIAKEVARAKESSDMDGIKLQTNNDIRKARRGLSCCTS